MGCDAHTCAHLNTDSSCPSLFSLSILTFSIHMFQIISLLMSVVIFDIIFTVHSAPIAPPLWSSGVLYPPASPLMHLLSSTYSTNNLFTSPDHLDQITPRSGWGGRQIILYLSSQILPKDSLSLFSKSKSSVYTTKIWSCQRPIRTHSFCLLLTVMCMHMCTFQEE